MQIESLRESNIIIQKVCLKFNKWNFHPKSTITVASNLVPLVHADLRRFQGFPFWVPFDSYVYYF